MKRNRKIGTKTVFVAETKGEKENENKRIEIGIRKGRGRIITREEGITTNIVTSRTKEVGERKERRSRETTEQNKSTTKHNI